MKKEICPCCGSNMWVRKKIDLMNDYLICNNCGLNFQEIPKNISNDEFFKIQQEHYFSDSDMLDSKLMIAVETEENKTKLNKFKKYSRNHKDVIEIGPGSGSFALLIESIVSSITLIEESRGFSQRLGQIFKGKIINKNLSDFKTEEKYDAAFTFQVIEHVNEILDYLLTIKSILKDDGLLFLTTPNADSFQHKLPLNLSPNFDNAHIYVFSLNSIKLLFNKAGFEIVEITTPEYSSTWLRVVTKIIRRILRKSETETAGQYMKNENTLLKVFFFIFKFVSFPFRKIQEKLNKGNEIFIVAKKLS
jgi:cyclopropane fatty-acyl-phospholipid synthase-like methyltransferase